MTSPNQLCLVFAAGVLISYAALVVPKGWIVLLVGLGCVLGAIVRGAAYPMRPMGITLLAGAMFFFFAEFCWNLIYIAGVLGTVMLVFGFGVLYSGPERISAGIAIPSGLALGLATTVVCATARRARMNKRFA